MDYGLCENVNENVFKLKKNNCFATLIGWVWHVEKFMWQKCKRGKHEKFIENKKNNDKSCIKNMWNIFAQKLKKNSKRSIQAVIH